MTREYPHNFTSLQQTAASATAQAIFDALLSHVFTATV